MALSGTYNFAPNLGELGLYALSRCDIRPSAVLQEHMFDLRMAANLVSMDWSNKGVNLWQVSLISQPLTQGIATYPVDPAVVLILDAYRTQGTGEGTTDQILLPVSRSEYASYPNKQQQGVPTTIWFDRLLAPVFNLYLTPDGTWPFLNYYVVRQLMDTNLANGGGIDIPAVALKAFSDALVAELSLTHAFAKYPTFKAVADASYLAFADTNIEMAAAYILPQTSGYYRP
jgi:hypothetical protein